MKIQLKNVFLVLIVSLSIMVLGVTPVFADQSTASVSIPQGVAQGCEESKECFIPYEIIVDVGGVVVWTNNDSEAHTISSGKSGQPSGDFNSGGIFPGDSFEHKFETVGVFQYYCKVHPWEEGVVTVQGTSGSDTKIQIDKNENTSDSKKNKGYAGEISDGTIIVGAPPEDKTTVTGISQDGNLRTEITVSNPEADEIMSLEIKFRDVTGSIKKHANYDIVVSQNEIDVLSIIGAHNHEGTGKHSTAPLNSGDKVDIKVTLLGFGLPDDQENWTGPKGEILMFNVVPEFGTISIMVLAVAILSIIAVSAKSKLNIMPKL